MERREFLEKTIAVGAGLMAVTARAREKTIPSDPGAAAAPAVTEAIALPPFEKTAAFPLEQALAQRRTSRNFAETPLSDEALSRLLWAMTGANRLNGHRTTPSAVAAYPVDVYIALPQGVYLFAPKEHRLDRVLAEDIRREVPLQPGGLKRAAMIVVYVADLKKVPGGESEVRYADLEIGCMVQNLYLQAAAMGLGACVFGLVRYENVAKKLGLKPSQLVRIAQAAGPLEG